MDDNPHIPALTPANVMDLRTSITWRVNDGTIPEVPHIIYAASEDGFILRAYGRPMCQHRDPALLAKLLRCERAEPGFIRRILDTREPCDVATLAPDARAHQAALRAQEAARSRQLADDARDRQLARVRVIDPSRISLDDL